MLFIYSSVLREFLIARGVILFLPSLRASFPAISNSSAVKYSKVAAMYTALPAPTRVLTRFYLIFLFILPTGNRSPAFEDLVFPVAILDLAFPTLTLAILTPGAAGNAAGADGLRPVMLSRDPVLASAALSFFFSLLWIGTWMGAGGGGGLLSKRLSGILETA